jgi:hypothetical protein
MFVPGPYRSHSGLLLPFKVDCDALTRQDWETLAAFIARRVCPFFQVLGVPQGGLPLQNALRSYQDASSKTTLIVDDVLTTGASMEEFARDVPGPRVGVVLFARGHCPSWVFPIFTQTML